MKYIYDYYVTKDIIANAIPGNAKACLLACAINAQHWSLEGENSGENIRARILDSTGNNPPGSKLSNFAASFEMLDGTAYWYAFLPQVAIDNANLFDNKGSQLPPYKGRTHGAIEPFSFTLEWIERPKYESMCKKRKWWERFLG